MNTKGKILGASLLIIAAFSLLLVGATEPADVKKATTLAAKSPEASAKPLEGTVVVRSSSDSDEDPYAHENTGEEAAQPSGPSFALTKDATTGLLTVDAPGEDIRSVVSKVADLYSLNIVIPSGLNGATTLKLRDVSWQQLFNVMLPPAGYAFVEDKNIILIKSREEISAEPTETRVFLINYGSAQEMLSAITPLVDVTNGGRIQVDKRSNALVITERPSRFNNIKDIIGRLDRATPQVLIESKFIEVTDSDAKNLGVDWTSLNSYKLSASNLKRTWARSENDASAGTRTSFVDSAVFSAPQFDVVLSALNTLSGSELISNPTVVTLNNTEAVINIGTEYPIPQYSYNQQQGVFEVSGFEYKPIGINLKVTPQVNSQGFITLNIAPEVSSQTGNVTFGGSNGALIPIISTRKTSSTISIKDGYTLAIGGLIEKKVNTASTKVPLLGDIPMAGKLFKGSQDTITRRNLMIFITARTVNPDGSGRQVVDPRVLNDMKITESDLPGYQVPLDEQKLIESVSARLEAAKREAAIRKLQGDNEKAAAANSRSSFDARSRAHGR